MTSSLWNMKHFYRCPWIDCSYTTKKSNNILGISRSGTFLSFQIPKDVWCTMKMYTTTLTVSHDWHCSHAVSIISTWNSCIVFLTPPSVWSKRIHCWFTVHASGFPRVQHRVGQRIQKFTNRIPNYILYLVLLICTNIMR